MKFFKRKITVALLALLVSLCVCVQANAEAVYVVNGYAYNILNNYSIAICGWEGESTDLVIPNALVGRNVVSVAARALKDNTEVTSVDFSNANYLNTIEMEAFYGCTGLTEVDIPRTVTAMGDNVFQNCTSLQSVNIHATMTAIPEMCFYNCTSLTEVSISPTVTEIKKFAFANCSALEYIEIPTTVTNIVSSAFRNTNVTIGCYFNSYAYQFAKDNNMPFKLLDQFVLGDANGDGKVNINDVTAIQRHLSELELLNDLQLVAADVNSNGIWEISDATTLQGYLAEYAVDYPINQTVTRRDFM